MALDSSARLMLFEALSEAASELTVELAPGSVDVRLRGRDPEFVVSMPAAAPDDTTVTPTDVPPASDTAGKDADDQATTRTTLRLPESLKLRAEAAAAREGVSLNSWLARAVAAALEAHTARPAPGMPRNSGNRYTGWVR